MSPFFVSTTLQGRSRAEGLVDLVKPMGSRVQSGDTEVHVYFGNAFGVKLIAGVESVEEGGRESSP